MLRKPQVCRREGNFSRCRRWHSRLSAVIWCRSDEMADTHALLGLRTRRPVLVLNVNGLAEAVPPSCRKANRPMMSGACGDGPTRMVMPLRHFAARGRQRRVLPKAWPAQARGGRREA